jgi:lariat debranching enzyme
MPAKYRKMADFHEYYSGARTAPYLTIFIGGNHEASNHLFELYYGGWVAPNIYYMGAANILRLGPLRIAGLSGIWKGYDYRKPHFERVPYNEAESVSIFHVRELDVRKMLSVRTQVDIGLSHDWPQGVEWKGDYRWLFRKKDRFEADANDGKLGSIAARQCLDRLRPSHWFSAHLHVKYAALIQHGSYEWVKPPREPRPRHGTPLSEPLPSRDAEEHQSETLSSVDNHAFNSSFEENHREQPSRSIDGSKAEVSSPSNPLKKMNHNANSTPNTPVQAQVSAWQNFHANATKAAAQDTELRLQEQKERLAQEERPVTRASPQYMFDETWKRVTSDDGLDRGIASVSKSMRSPGEDTKMANMDGCVESKLKRARSNSPNEMMKNGRRTPPPKLRNTLSGQLDGQVQPSAVTSTRPTRNTDEIEIDLSDSSSEGAGAKTKLAQPVSSKVLPGMAGDGGSSPVAQQNSSKRAKSEAVMSDDSDEGGVKLDSTSPPFMPETKAFFQPSIVEDHIKEEATSTSDTLDGDQDKVSDAMRAQLAELSSSFAPVSKQQPISAPLPLPEGIANRTTQFLALDKCERGRDFLQLLEVEPTSEQTFPSDTRPCGLEYDKEWLAILRVFEPELTLGGDSNERIPPHRGDTYYRDRINEEEEWIEEHVVKTGKLRVPQNFTITAPVYDPKAEVAPSDKPREYTSPQTSALCELIGIENKFDISEEERETRMARGPRPVEKSFSRGGRGGARGGRDNGFNGRGRAGFTGPRGARGRSGGRARGRARW